MVRVSWLRLERSRYLLTQYSLHRGEHVTAGVSHESPHTVNSSLDTSVMVPVCSTITIHMDGGCHVILERWCTGGGASVSGKWACGMTNSCANSYSVCNCDKDDYVWREDCGLLTDKTRLPVKQLRFGDTAGRSKGYHTLEVLWHSINSDP